MLAGAVGLGAGALALAWSMGGEEASTSARCSPDTARAEVERIWNPNRSETVAEALAGTGVPYAKTTTRTVQRTLDDFTAQWTEARTAACRAAWEDTERPPVELDRRLACLRDALTNAEALVVRLESATPSFAKWAPAAVASLPPPARCDEPGTTPLDDSPEARALRARLAQARAARLLGEPAEAATEAEQVAAEAEAANLRGIHGEALFEWSRAQDKLAPGSATAQIERAHAIALELDDAEATAWRALEAANQVSDNELERTERWFRHADAAIARIASPSIELRAYRQKVECKVANAQRRATAALAACQRATTISNEAPDALPNLQWSIGNDTANALGLLGRHAEKTDRLTELREQAINRHGRLHVRVAGTTMNLAVAARDTGDLERSLLLLGEAQEMFSAIYDPNHHWVVTTLLQQASTLNRLERYERALAALQDAQQRHGDTRNARTLRIMYTIAETHRRAGNLDAASAQLDRVEALEEELLPPEHIQRADTQHARGMVAKAREQWPEARARFGRALELQKETPSSDRTARAYSMLTEIALAEGNFEDAEASARRVEAMFETISVSVPDHVTNLVHLSRSLSEQGKLDDATAQLDTADELLEGREGSVDDEVFDEVRAQRARIAALRPEATPPK